MVKTRSASTNERPFQKMCVNCRSQNSTLTGARQYIDAFYRFITSMPEWVESNFKGTTKDTPIAMFCTGGIRCEKSSAWMIEQGYTNVYQLEGDILKYFEETKDSENLWNGRCFVFDDRVAMNKDLTPYCDMN